MAKCTVTYVGDVNEPKSNPDVVTFRGVTFPIGKPVNLDVTTDDGEAMMKKLSNNRNFKVEGWGGAEKPAKAKAGAAP